MRAALSGVSHWHGNYHGTAMKEAGAVIVGACDENPAKTAGFVAQFGGSAYSSIEEMVARSKPDFVMAMGRHVDMPKIALTLLEIGIPFGIEKPIGLKADDLIPVMEVAEKRKAFVAVPLINRYSLLWRKLEDLEGRGRAGGRLHAHFRIINGTAERYNAAGVSWMLRRELSGGGSLRNLGIHGADAFVTFSGAQPEVVAARLGNTGRGYEVEEYSAALVTGNGVIGTLESGYTYATRQAGGDFEWCIATENCYMIDRGKTLTVATLDDGNTVTFDNIVAFERYKMFGRDTLDRLRKGAPPVADLRDCHRAMLLLDAIYAKSGEGPSV